MSQRPRIDVPKTPWDYVADAVGVLGVVLSVLLLAASWMTVPDSLHRPFGLSGDRDSWPDRWTTTFPLVLAIVNYVVLRLMTRIPHYFNYPWPITQENAAIQYQLSRSMVYWLNAVVVWMLLLIAWSQIRVAVAEMDRFPALLIVVSLVLLHLILGAFIYRAYQHRHGSPASDTTGSRRT